MDPTTCFQFIRDLVETHDYAEARTYAAILFRWLSGGGFYPEGYQPERVDAVLEELLNAASAPNAIRTKFQSITCYDCDAGQDITSLKQAIDEGWIDIVGDDDLTVTSHLGTCPVCRMEGSQELLSG